MHRYPSDLPENSHRESQRLVVCCRIKTRNHYYWFPNRPARTASRPAQRTVVTDAKKPFWAGKPPTSALIGMAALALPEWLIEIESVAVLDD